MAHAARKAVPGNENGLVAVANGYGLPETQAALCLLRAHGIEPVATPLHMASIFWQHMIAVGGVEILVPRRQEALARDLIAGFNAPPYSAARRLPVAARLLLAALVWFLFTVPPPATGFFPRAAVVGSARD